MSLVERLIQDGWLKTPRIIEAFREINRADFLPESMRYLAEVNEALPIGQGQTISQPLTVAFMLELLQPKSGEKILDIGSGSGWTTALLAHIVSQEENLRGKIIAIEVVPELKEFGEKNAAKYGFAEKGITEFVLADGSKGYEKEAPFDKILCSAALSQKRKLLITKTSEEPVVPQIWKEQLREGGRIVVPISSSIWLFTKKYKEGFEGNEYPGFAFVPFIENK